MNEIKLRPGEEFVYNGIRFICLDIIDGNYLAITADWWCELENVNAPSLSQ